MPSEYDALLEPPTSTSPYDALLDKKPVAQPQQPRESIRSAPSLMKSIGEIVTGQEKGVSDLLDVTKMAATAQPGTAEAARLKEEATHQFPIYKPEITPKDINATTPAGVMTRLAKRGVGKLSETISGLLTVPNAAIALGTSGLASSGKLLGPAVNRLIAGGFAGQATKGGIESEIRAAALPPGSSEREAAHFDTLANAAMAGLAGVGALHPTALDTGLKKVSETPTPEGVTNEKIQAQGQEQTQTQDGVLAQEAASVQPAAEPAAAPITEIGLSSKDLTDVPQNERAQHLVARGPLEGNSHQTLSGEVGSDAFDAFASDSGRTTGPQHNVFIGPGGEILTRAEMEKAGLPTHSQELAKQNAAAQSETSITPQTPVGSTDIPGAVAESAPAETTPQSQAADQSVSAPALSTEVPSAETSTEPSTTAAEKSPTKADFAKQADEQAAAATAKEEAKAAQDQQQGKFDLREEAMRQADLQEPSGRPSQKMGITAPTSAFIKQDVARVVGGAFQNAIKGFKQIRNILAPAAAGPDAKLTANIIRENAAELARKHEIAATTLETASKAFKKTTNQFNLDVIDKLENGKTQATPELDAFSKEIRAQLDERVRQVQAINPNALQNLIQDYFPHIWTPESIAKLQNDPNPVTRNVWSEVFGKRPLEGQKSFLKQRTIPTTMEGVALGLEPVSWNPVELQLLKLHEMDRYIMGQKIMGEMKDQSLAKFVQAGQPPEPGNVQINDKIARVLAPRDWKIVDEKGNQVPGQKLLGHYYAPEDAARVINNYLSPGLSGNVAYDAFRRLGNMQNQVQLGISLYHATFTSLDAATSSFSLGLEQLARSGGSPKEIGTASLNIAKGLGEAATGVGGLIENLWRGNKFLREYSRPGTTNADLAHIVDTAVAGGARIKMDTFYNTGAVKSFFDAIKAENYTGAALRAPFAAIEAASKPLMEYAVPRMKAGVISQMLEYELSKLPKGATQNDIRTIAGRVVDSVDNRMGQMIYDNLFWNRILKDGLMASVRSVGWNVGDIREIGGGMLDAVTAPARAYREIKGKSAISDNPVVTHRMAYVVGLPLIVGALGSMYQYLMTGQGPQSLQDAFMPRTGRKKADGTDERVMLPTYMKDIAPLAIAGQRGFIPLISRGVGMAQNKLHPTLTMLSQMFHNQDYYGNQIRNLDDGFVKTVQKEALFAIKQWKPFSVQGVMQREGGVKEKLQAVAGIMPAPGELTRTPAMQMIHEINLAKRPAGGYTEQQQQRRDDKRAASEGADLRLPLFKRLSQEERDRVMEVATDEEKAIFSEVARVKHRNKFTIVK